MKAQILLSRRIIININLSMSHVLIITAEIEITTEHRYCFWLKHGERIYKLERIPFPQSFD